MPNTRCPTSVVTSCTTRSAARPSAKQAAKRSTSPIARSAAPSKSPPGSGPQMTVASCPPLAVSYQPVTALAPDPRNARTHPKRQVEQIAGSIRAFGFANPILVDADGKIIAGHGRLLAAKAAGMTEVPTIVLPYLSEAQQRALRIADNKIALGAGWDLDLLKIELGELAVLDVDIDIALTGFSSGEIDVIRKSAADPEDELIPAVPVNPRSRPGDIWLLGEHRVGCGDGRDLGFLQAVV